MKHLLCRVLLGWVLICVLSIPTGHTLSGYTNKELDELEKEFRQQINQSQQVIRDPLAQQYINHLGKRLFKDQDGRPPYFFIVDSNEINAFAGPGGLIGINSALILTSESESELASVMAHEMAHVEQHHLYRALEHQKQMRVPMLASILASIALGIINPVLGQSAMMASLTGLSQDRINFVRSNEKEADRIGIQFLKRAKINPYGMVSFFKKMHQNSRYYYTDNIPAILRTHPLDEDRIAEAENRITKIKNMHYQSDFNYFYFRELIRVLSVTDRHRLEQFYQYQCQKSSPKKACEYGLALLASKLQHYVQAESLLNKLDQKNPDNIFIQLALADSEQSNAKRKYGLSRLQALYEDYPDNYAVITTYGRSLLLHKQTEKAVSVLIGGQRLFPNDISMCYQLARAENKNKQLSYAYFTQAQCFLLEGHHRDAFFQLKQAQKYDKKDTYIQMRIQALKDDIKLLENG